MADRKLRVLLKKIYSNGDKDTIFFKSRAKDVFIDEDGSTTLQDTVDKVNAIQSGATKVEDSNTNGNIKINGAETNVYTHPNSGVTAGTYNKVTVNAQGHVTSASNVTNWTGTVSGDISNATATFTTASSRANITSGANIKTTLGKIAKYFADLKSLAFVDKVGTANLDTTLTTAYNNRVTTDKVTTSTSITASGWVADARAIATLQNQINTINSNLVDRIFLQNNFAYGVSDESGITIPHGSYSYIYFSDSSSSKHVTITKSNGYITFHDTGYFLIVVTLNIYELEPNEAIDFAWNHNLECYYRIEGSSREYTTYSITYPYYVNSAPRSTIAVLFNPNSRDIDYAFCSIFIWKLPIDANS